MSKEKLIQKLDKENKKRWIGKADYSCLTCANAFSRPDDALVCVATPAHKIVDDDHLCKDWN